MRQNYVTRHFMSPVKKRQKRNVTAFYFCESFERPSRDQRESPEERGPRKEGRGRSALGLSLPALFLWQPRALPFPPFPSWPRKSIRVTRGKVDTRK
jgi:hypothetical protein